MQSLNYEITTLDNGIRVITETVNHVQFFSMGIWVGVGSRYETEEQWGITITITITIIYIYLYSTKK